MPPLRVLLAWWTLAAALAAPRLATAQFNPEAEKLFRDGKDLMKQKKFAEACDAFDASQKLDPNLATLMSLADCREKNGQLVTAWGLFVQAESRAQGEGLDKLAETARKRSNALEARYSVITIQVPPASRIAGLTIVRAGKSVDPAVWNKEVPLDGGSYELIASAPGRKTWTRTVVVPTQNGKIDVAVPVLEAQGAVRPPPPEPPPKPTPVVEPPPPQDPIPAPAAPRDDEPRSGKRQVAITVTVITVGLLAAGAFAGYQAKSLDQNSIDECPPANCSIEAAMRAEGLNGKARKAALAANILLGAGAIGIVTSVVLWAKSSPKRKSTALQIAPRVEPTYAGLEARFGF